jgi:hypothetical protein
MITIKDLEGLKLVQDDNFTDEETVRGALEHGITQGSQGWGVELAIAVQLHLARDLRTALLVAADAKDLRNALKGKQLELGRVKAQLAAVKTKLDKALATD